MNRRSFLSNLALGVVALPALASPKQEAPKLTMEILNREKQRIINNARWLYMVDGEMYCLPGGEATRAILHYRSGAPFPSNMGECIRS